MLTQLRAILFLILILGAQCTNLQMQKRHNHNKNKNAEQTNNKLHKHHHQNLQTNQDISISQEEDVVISEQEEQDFGSFQASSQPVQENITIEVVDSENVQEPVISAEVEPEEAAPEYIQPTHEDEFQVLAAQYYTFDSFYGALTTELQETLDALERQYLDKKTQCSDLQTNIEESTAAIGKAEGYIIWLQAKLEENLGKRENVYGERCEAHQIFITYLHNAKITLRLTAFLKQAITNYTLAQVKQVGKIMKNFLDPKFLTNTDAVKQMLVQLQQVDGGEENINDAVSQPEPVRSRTEEEIGTEHVDNTEGVLDLESYEASKERNLDVYKQQLVEILGELEKRIDTEINRRQDNEIELNERVVEFVTKVETDMYYSRYEIEKEEQAIEQLQEFLAGASVQSEICETDLQWVQKLHESQMIIVYAVTQERAEIEKKYIEYWSIRPQLWAPGNGKVFDLDNFDGYGLRVMSQYGEGRIDIGVNYNGSVEVNSAVVQVDGKFNLSQFVDATSPNSKDLSFALLEEQFASLVSSDDKQVFKIQLPGGCDANECGRYYLISTISADEEFFSGVHYYNAKVYIGGDQFAYYNPQWITQQQTAFFALELYYNVEKSDWFIKPLSQAYTWGDLLNTDGTQPRDTLDSGIQAKLSSFGARALNGSGLSTAEWQDGDRAIHFINYNQQQGIKLPQSLQNSLKIGFDWSGDFNLDFGAMATDAKFYGTTFVDASQPSVEGITQRSQGLTTEGDRLEVEVTLNKANSRYYFASSISEVSFESVEYLKWTIYSGSNVFTFYQDQGKTNINAFQSQSFIVFEVYQNSQDEGAWYLRFFNYWVDEDSEGGAYDTPFCNQVRRVIRSQAFTTVDISESGAELGYNLSDLTWENAEIRFLTSDHADLRVDVYGTNGDYSNVLGGVKGDANGNFNASGSVTKVLTQSESGEWADYWSLNLTTIPQGTGSLFVTVQYTGTLTFSDVSFIQFDVTNGWEVYYTKYVSPSIQEASQGNNYYFALELYRNVEDGNKWYVRNRNLWILTGSVELNDQAVITAIHQLNPNYIPQSVKIIPDEAPAKNDPNAQPTPEVVEEEVVVVVPPAKNDPNAQPTPEIVEEEEVVVVVPPAKNDPNAQPTPEIVEEEVVVVVEEEVVVVEEIVEEEVVVVVPAKKGDPNAQATPEVQEHEVDINHGVKIPTSENSSVLEFYMSSVLTNKIQVQSFALGTVLETDHYQVVENVPGNFVTNDNESISYRVVEEQQQQAISVNLGTLEYSTVFFGYIVENNSSFFSSTDSFSIQVRIGGIQHINFQIDAPTDNKSVLVALRLWYNSEDGFYYLKKLSQYSTNCHGHQSECLSNIFNPNAVPSTVVDEWTPEDDVTYDLSNFGQGIKIPSSAVNGLDLGFAWETVSADLDGGILIADDNYVVWERVYWNNATPINGISYSGDARSGEAAGDDETITIDFDSLAPWVSHLFVVVSVYDKDQLTYFSDVSKTQITVYVGGKIFTFYTIDPSDPTTSENTTVVIAEFFKNHSDSNSWYLKSRNNWFLENADGSQIRDCNEVGLDSWVYGLGHYDLATLSPDQWGPYSNKQYDLQASEAGIKLPQRFIYTRNVGVGFTWASTESVDLDGSIILADSTYGVTDTIDWEVTATDSGSVFQYDQNIYGDNETMFVKFQLLDDDTEHIFVVVSVYDDDDLTLFDDVSALYVTLYIADQPFATVAFDPSVVGSGQSTVILAEIYQNEDDDFNWYIQPRQDWFRYDADGYSIRGGYSSTIDDFIQELEYDI